MIQKNDAALVADTLSGQVEAFTTLVLKHQRYAYGMASGLLSDVELVQDVVQDSLLCAYRDLGKLQNPEQFSSWLCGIVKNTAYSVIRKQKRDRLLANELQVASSVAVPLPDQRILTAETHKLVQLAVNDLSQKYRRVLRLYYHDNLSYAEIAAQIGVNVTTVKGRLQHARSKLRKSLGNAGKDACSMEGTQIIEALVGTASDAVTAQCEEGDFFAPGVAGEEDAIFRFVLQTILFNNAEPASGLWGKDLGKGALYGSNLYAS